jgi:hypothetical protein
MQDRVRGKLRSVQIPEPMVDRLVDQIPQLGRWRSAS